MNIIHYVAFILLLFLPLSSFQSDNQLWHNYIHGIDLDPHVTLGEGRNTVVDDDRNIYTTGSIDNGFSVDFFTAKYNPEGNLIWHSIYNSQENHNDRGVAIAIGTTGYVVVTGTSHGGSITIKYSADTGSMEWEKKSDIEAKVMAIDASGNIVVAGSSYSTTNNDYTTIKYANSNGSEMWVANYNGSGDWQDYIKAIAVDPSDNIVVTGYSRELDTVDDLTTIKYDGSTGAEHWIAHYDGPVNGFDKAVDLDIDSLGNVVVTGTSQGLDFNYDYLTISYDGANGNERWLSRYDYGGEERAVSIQIDSSDNVLVTGTSDGSIYPNENYATIKYSGANGTEIWVSRFVENLEDSGYVRSLTIDKHNDVLITGTIGGPGSNDFTTVKYSGLNGEVSWFYNHDGLDNPDSPSITPSIIETDLNGDVIVSSNSGGDLEIRQDGIQITKLSGTTGNLLWTANEEIVTKSHTKPAAFVNDSSGNLYITGIADYAVGSDYLTVKLDPNGHELWRKTYSDIGIVDAEATSIALDSNGDVIVTGYSTNGPAEGQGNYTTIKYDGSSGVERWISKYLGSWSSYTRRWPPPVVKVDNNNDVIVTGMFGTIKYAGISGTEIWFNATWAADLEIDSNNDVLIISSEPVFSTSKLDGENGSLIWKAVYDEGEKGIDAAVDIVINDNNDVFVAGNSLGSDHYMDFLTIKYSSITGDSLWQARYAAGSDGKPNAMAIDSKGDVIVTGMRRGTFVTAYSTVKYAGNTGEELWSVRYAGPRYTISEAQAISVGHNDAVFITGFYTGDYTTGQDYATVKYRSVDGMLLWKEHYSTDNSEEAIGIIADSEYIYITGQGINPENGFYGILTLKYGYPYTVTPTTLSFGSISPDMPQTVYAGETISFTITPDLGFDIRSVTGCDGVLDGNTYTTAPISEECMVYASFLPQNTTCTIGNVLLNSITYQDGDIIGEQAEGRLYTVDAVILESGSTVVYEATTSIELNPGFQAHTGSVFSARVRPVSCAF